MIRLLYILILILISFDVQSQDQCNTELRADCGNPIEEVSDDGVCYCFACNVDTESEWIFCTEYAEVVAFTRDRMQQGEVASAYEIRAIQAHVDDGSYKTWSFEDSPKDDQFLFEDMPEGVLNDMEAVSEDVTDTNDGEGDGS